jgi:hypothetical protein
MGRSGESAGKRRVTALRNERKAAKNERRQQRHSTSDVAGPDDGELMARFHELNQLRAVAAVTEADYQRERADIFRTLGLEDPFAPTEPLDVDEEMG